MLRQFSGEIINLKHTYGFIFDSEGNYRWFHEKYVKGVTFADLEIGDRVEFTPFVGPRGRRAEDVRLIPRRV